MYHGQDSIEVILNGTECKVATTPDNFSEKYDKSRLVLEKSTHKDAPSSKPLTDMDSVEVGLPVLMHWSPLAKHLDSLRSSEEVFVESEQEQKDPKNERGCPESIQRAACKQDEKTSPYENMSHAYMIENDWLHFGKLNNLREYTELDITENKQEKLKPELSLKALKQAILKFETTVSQSVRYIKHVELRKRGYRLQGLLPPIARIEYNESINNRSTKKSMELGLGCRILRECLFEQLRLLVHALNCFFKVDCPDLTEESMDRSEVDSVKLLLWNLQAQIMDYYKSRATFFKTLQCKLPNIQLEDLVNIVDSARNTLVQQINFISKEDVGTDKNVDGGAHTLEDKQEKMEFEKARIRISLSTKNLEEKLIEMTTDLFHFRQDAMSTPSREDCVSRSAELKLSFPKLVEEMNKLWSDLEKDMSELKNPCKKQLRKSSERKTVDVELPRPHQVNGTYIVENENLDDGKPEGERISGEEVTMVFQGRVNRRERVTPEGYEGIYDYDDSYNEANQVEEISSHVLGELKDVLTIRKDVLPRERVKKLQVMKDGHPHLRLTDADQDRNSECESEEDDKSTTADEQPEPKPQPQFCMNEPLKNSFLAQLNSAINKGKEESYEYEI